MYLSDQELLAAIKAGTLIVKPPPDRSDVGPTSIDLHLDKIKYAFVWDVRALERDNRDAGLGAREVYIAKHNYPVIAKKYLKRPQKQSKKSEDEAVVRRDQEIIIRPHGFVLWQTKEEVGTPDEDGAKYICFIDGKSKRARSGLLVHMTAPTIHARWNGKVILELSNLGPFDIVLEENDVVAQIIVAQVTSPPVTSQEQSQTYQQRDATGRALKGKLNRKK